MVGGKCTVVMPSSTPPGRRHFRGIDGLRAIAVLLVIAFHLSPNQLPGGFLGVDLFFVISGFLITDQLRQERARTTRIDLRRFWLKRARRLVPALSIVVIVCGAATLFIAADTGVKLPAQVLGAVTFSSNWLDISQANNYFSADVRPLFQNLWSLAVEEQFYLLWPLVFVAAAALLATRRALRLPAVLLAVTASITVPSLYLLSGASPSRVYFGTDTHSYALIVGAVLAFLLPPGGATATTRRRWIDRVRVDHPDLLVAVALTTVLLASITLNASSALTFVLWLPLVSLFAAVLIWGVTSPTSLLVRWLDAKPLKYIGRRSYGLYLWHWPIFVLVSTVFRDPGGSDVSVQTIAATGALTFLFAGLSHRFIELPVMRDGFGATLHRFTRSFLATRPVMQAVVAAALVGLLASSVTGVAGAPTVTLAEQFVLAGQQQLSALDKDPAPVPTASVSPHPQGSRLHSPRPTPTTSPATPPLAPAPVTPTPVTPTPISVPGTDITAIGDSVMLASAPALLQQFPGIAIDAKVSRQTSDAPAIIDALVATHQLRRVLIVALGTNGLYRAGDIASVERAAGPGHEIILVNAYGPRSWTEGVNNQIAAAAIANPNIAIADWHDQISGHLDLLAPDQIHPAAAGGVIYSAAIASALQLWSENHAGRRAHRIAP